MKNPTHDLAQPFLAVNQDHEPARKKNATRTSSVINLANTILGSGVLAMPWTLAASGLIPFVILLVLMGLIADYAVFLLFTAVEAVHVYEYADLGKKLFGRPGELLAMGSVTFQQFGACTVYIFIIADVIAPILQLVNQPWACTRWTLQLAIVVAVIFPLCLLPNIDNLKYTSFIALALEVALIIALLVSGVRVIMDDSLRNTEFAPPPNVTNTVCKAEASCEPVQRSLEGIALWPSSPLSFVSALPIITFAFLCHQNTFPIYLVTACILTTLSFFFKAVCFFARLLFVHGGKQEPEFFWCSGKQEMKNASLKSITAVSKFSILICGILYLISGFFGYFIFLDGTNSDVLTNFAVSGRFCSNSVFTIVVLFCLLARFCRQESLILDVLRVGFGLAMVFSYPIIVWEARSNIDRLLFGRKAYSFKRYLFLNVCIIGTTTAIGISAKNIKTVLGIIGATCSPIMVSNFSVCHLLHR